MGAVADQITWTDALKAEAKVFLRIDFDDDDTLLEMLFKSAVKLTDDYINDRFEHLCPTVRFASVVADDWIQVNGRLFTAKAAGEESEDDRCFSLGSSDADAATNFAALVNSATLGGSYDEVGVAGVIASVDSATVTLKPRYPDASAIEVLSSDDDRLLVRQVRTFMTGWFPEDTIKHWIFQFMHRRYENREGLLQEKEDGKGSKQYAAARGDAASLAVDYSLLAPYRLSPGI